MEAMEAESEGKFTYRQIYGHIKDGKYPEVLETECEVVGTGPSFSKCMQEMHLCYTGGMFYVNVRLAIHPSLAKLAKRICDLQHRLAIIYYDINLHPFFLVRKKITFATPRLVIKDQELRKTSIPKIVKNSWFCSACR